MKCKNCGQEVQDGWKVCPFCGAEVKAAKTTKKKSEPKDEELFEFSEDTAQFEEAFEKQQTEQTKQAFTFSGDTSEYGDAFDNQLKKQKKDEENAKAKAYAAAKLAEERKAKAEAAAEAARKKKVVEEEARKKREAEEDARKKREAEETARREWDEKFKKDLEIVGLKLELGEFLDAESQLNAIEAYVVKEKGKNEYSEIYLYRIYIEFKAHNQEELIKNIAKSYTDITQNKNFILTKHYASATMARQLDSILNKVNDEYELQAELKRQEEENALRQKERARRKAKHTISVIGIIAGILVLVGLLAFSIWSVVYFKNLLWPCVLLTVAAYSIVIIGIYVILVLRNYGETEGFGYILICWYAAAALAAFILFFIKSQAVWAWVLALCALIGNGISLILSFIFGDDDCSTLFIVLTIISAIFFVIATVIISQYGWSIYF